MKSLHLYKTLDSHDENANDENDPSVRMTSYRADVHFRGSAVYMIHLPLISVNSGMIVEGKAHKDLRTAISRREIQRRDEDGRK